MLDIVVELALDLADAFERILERGALLHQRWAFWRIVPEIGVFGELVQLGEARLDVSTSKMPPQQPDRPLDVFDERSFSARMVFSDLRCEPLLDV